MECEICERGGPQTTLFRMNKPGEMPPVWRCRECMSLKQRDNVDAGVMSVVNAIEGRDSTDPHE